MKIISGIHKGKIIEVPKTSLRPTTSFLRETLFNILQNYIEGAVFLDLFAGSGAIGLEALSRGARQVIFVEKDKKAVTILLKNLKNLKEERRASCYSQDVFLVLEKLAKKGPIFDIIFADPPYGEEDDSYTNAVLEFVDNHNLLKEEGLLFLEDARKASKDDILLKTLELNSSRKVGNTVLREYKKI